MNRAIRALEFYKRLPYTLRTEPVQEPDGSSYWTAEYVELRGCKTDGTTEAEAVANVQELFDEYILARLESQTEIPEPAKLPAIIEELWIVVPKRRVSVEVVSPDVGDTEQTKGETIPALASSSA
jgi:predicted RNase H-like HicB family nuclease